MDCIYDTIFDVQDLGWYPGYKPINTFCFKIISLGVKSLRFATHKIIYLMELTHLGSKASICVTFRVWRDAGQTSITTNTIRVLKRVWLASLHININWRTPSLSKLTPIILNIELIYLGLKASNTKLKLIWLDLEKKKPISYLNRPKLHLYASFLKYLLIYEWNRPIRESVPMLKQTWLKYWNDFKIYKHIYFF